MNSDVKKVLISEAEIQQKVKELAERISKDYKGKHLLMICILKGAIMFYSDLARNISIPMAMDFMAVSSYGAGTKTSGEVRILKDLSGPAEGLDILIVEDILDSGNTLNYIENILKDRNPASLKICTLLDKPERREKPIVVDYVGFAIPDEFVIGYGLDYSERYRNLPYIGVLKEEVYASPAE
ncbi:MAG: hypoxanthine phosphoribosyltransferase [Clostridia bacterium]|nr:hypoxanthine phosphoribosyltransferase [Clostridia bacterium]